MSVKVMGRVWDLKLTPAKQMVLLALADHAAHDGSGVKPGVPLIAWKTGYSERQVQRIMKDLEADELLVKVRVVQGRPTIYRIDLTKGVVKETFKPRSENSTPDNLSSETDANDDDYTQGDILSGVTSHGKQDMVGGDIASANLTSIHQSTDPSERETRAPEANPTPQLPLKVLPKTESQGQPLSPHSAPPPHPRKRYVVAWNSIAEPNGFAYYADGQPIPKDLIVFTDACNDLFYAWLDALEAQGRAPDTARDDLWAKHRTGVVALAKHRRTAKQIDGFVHFAYSNDYPGDFYRTQPAPITFAAISGAIGTWLTQQAATSARSASAQTANTLPAAVRRTPEEIEQLKRDKENILAEIKQESA